MSSEDYAPITEEEWAACDPSQGASTAPPLELVPPTKTVFIINVDKEVIYA